MTQPPDEPPEQPGDGWQPPGPPPPAQQPPQQYPSYPYPYGTPPQPNPYGGSSTTPYQPIESGGMPTAVKVVLGVVIGLFAGFFLWFVAAIGLVGAGSGDDQGFLLLAAVAPLLVPAPLLIWRATRPWAVGLLIGTAVSSVGLSSLCSSVINGTA